MGKDVLEMQKNIEDAKTFDEFVDASMSYLSEGKNIQHDGSVPFEDMVVAISSNLYNQVTDIVLQNKKLNAPEANKAVKLANLLMQEQPDFHSDEKKSAFMVDIEFVYKDIARSGHKLDSKDDLQMLKYSHPMIANDNHLFIGGLCTRLDDYSVATEYMRCADEDLRQIEKNNLTPVGLDRDIEKFAEIVKHHPPMVKKCNSLVKRTADLSDKYFDSDDISHLDEAKQTYTAACEYFNKVIGMDGVSNYDKTMARGRATTYGEKARIAGEKTEKLKLSEWRNKNTEEQTSEKNDKKGPKLHNILPIALKGPDLPGA